MSTDRSASQDKEIINDDEFDGEEIFNKEVSHSTSIPEGNKETPEMSASEIEKYDRMIQEAFDNEIEYAKDVDEDVKEVKHRRTGKMSVDDRRLQARQAVEFVHKMDNAYALDMEAFSRGEVVDNRLKMIKEVERTMCNTDLAKLCLTCGIIPVFCNWIRPGSHGELPFSRIRSGIYRILLTLPIKKAHIKEGRIGELIVKLWRHPKESEENRVILHQIIEKWLRKVTGMSADFSDEANEGMEDAAKVKADYLASINRSRDNRFTKEQDEHSVFAMMPKGQLNAYVNDAPSLKIKGGDKENPNSLGVILRKMENNPRKRAR